MGSASGGFNKRNKNNKAIPPEKAVRMVLPIEGEMPKGRGGLYFMKKKYINPEIKTIELLSNTMMLTVSEQPRIIGNEYASGNEALSTGRRNTGADNWSDPWN